MDFLFARSVLVERVGFLSLKKTMATPSLIANVNCRGPSQVPYYRANNLMGLRESGLGMPRTITVADDDLQPKNARECAKKASWYSRKSEKKHCDLRQ